MGCPNFTAPSLRGVELGERGPAAKRGNAYLPRLARLLMQLHGSSQVSPQIALGNESVRARAQTSGVQAAVCFAGVAQLVEHLFCKQVVRGSSPLASSVQSARGSTGGAARASRVRASFSFRSGAHVQKYVPLRSSGKPRQNAELRTRVSVGPVAVPRAVPLPHQSASSLARSASVRLTRSASATVRESSESCPSGQREQAVNLPDLSYAGSNPALSTKRSRPSAGTNQAGLGFTASGRGRGRAMSAFAGVAQLVERQPSKLNVEGSSPFSRSGLRAGAQTSSVSGAQLPPAEVNSAGPPLRFRGPSPKTLVSASARQDGLVRRDVWVTLATRMTRGSTRVASSVAVEAEASTGAERTSVREHRSAAEAKTPAEIATRPVSHEAYQQPHAHLAQMVEHVLGKDEVTSSILVVGSKQ